MLSYKEYIDKYAKVAYDEYVNGYSIDDWIEEFGDDIIDSVSRINS